MAKSRVGQTTGRKLDAEMVAREMRRARDPYNIRLFQVLVFLSQSDALRQSDPDEMHVQASEEESNFSKGKGSCRNSSAPASFGIRPARPLCLGDGGWPKERETAYATVWVRRHGIRYTSPIRARNSSILGACEVFY